MMNLLLYVKKNCMYASAYDAKAQQSRVDSTRLASNYQQLEPLVLQ